jgi:hypothetical protein
LIDDFTTGPKQLAAMGVTQAEVAAGLDPAAVLGGSRYLTVRSLGGATGNAEVAVGGGRFRFTNASGQLSYFTLGYGDYSFNGSVTPLHLDLTADGADRFVVDVVDYTHGSGTGSGTSIVLWVRGAAAAGTIYRAANLTIGDPGHYVVPFSAFGDLQLTDVAGLGLDTGRAPNGREFIISRLATVPEPDAWALVVMAGLAVAPVRRCTRRWTVYEARATLPPRPRRVGLNRKRREVRRLAGC